MAEKPFAVVFPRGSSNSATYNLAWTASLEWSEHYPPLGLAHGSLLAWERVYRLHLERNS